MGELSVMQQATLPIFHDIVGGGMTPEQYLDLKEQLISLGYADEIDWCENVDPLKQTENFLFEYIWVVCNSGMKNQIAEVIYKRILQAIIDHKPISKVFGHKGKVGAIEYVIKHRVTLVDKFKNAKDKLTFLETLPWIGKITKYHLARNLGFNYVKPDRHLQRIADQNNTTPMKLCSQISNIIGDRIGTVDVVIWRAANLGLI